MTSIPTRILVANDQEWTGRSLESIFEAEGWEVLRAYTGLQAVDRSLEAHPDLIVLDFQLPDISGPDVCRRLRADPRVGWATPIVITTAGSNGRARQAEALEAGAWDFVAQPFDGPLLLARLGTFLRARMEFKSAQALAMVDEGTGLYNARGLSHRLQELASDASRRHQPLSCVVLSVVMPDLAEAAQAARDLDRTIGRAIRDAVRGSDAVGVVGPLEYAVLVPTMSQQAAGELVHRIERSVSALRPAGVPPLRLEAAAVDVGASPRLEEVLGRTPRPVPQADPAGSSG